MDISLKSLVHFIKGANKLLVTTDITNDLATIRMTHFHNRNCSCQIVDNIKHILFVFKCLLNVNNRLKVAWATAIDQEIVSKHLKWGEKMHRYTYHVNWKWMGRDHRQNSWNQAQRRLQNNRIKFLSKEETNELRLATDKK